MEPAPKRLSRPVYESLPWLYLVCGVAACVGSYFLPSGVLSLIVGFAGIAAVLGGVVILLAATGLSRAALAIRGS